MQYGEGRNTELNSNGGEYSFLRAFLLSSDVRLNRIKKSSMITMMSKISWQRCDSVLVLTFIIHDKKKTEAH
jgi:hypothetical protein